MEVINEKKQEIFRYDYVSNGTASVKLSLYNIRLYRENILSDNVSNIHPVTLNSCSEMVYI